MSKQFAKKIIISSILIVIASACKKNDNTNQDATINELKKTILSDIATKVCSASYEDMYTKAEKLRMAVNAFSATTTNENLNACKNAWKDLRSTWERSEAWLFGPIKANAIDPRIDTWPVNFKDLDGLLQNNYPLTEAHVDNLDLALKGFHPIEYILWGIDGNKSVFSLTAREKEYLISLTQNLVKLSKEVRDTWSNGYSQELASAGNGSNKFPTMQSAYLQIVDAMSSICEEVAGKKIKRPFDLQDPTQEESAFSKNSMTDFINNIQGVMDIYQGKFLEDGKGIEDLMNQTNRSLDAEIKSKHTAAIFALQAIYPKSFGDAIMTDQSKLQHAIDKIDDLQRVLDEKLRPFLQQQLN